jgi:hypothetical protein
MISLSKKLYSNFLETILPKVKPPAPNCLDIVITLMQDSLAIKLDQYRFVAILKSTDGQA